MRRLYLLIVIFIGFDLTSCATKSSYTQQALENQPKKTMANHQNQTSLALSESSKQCLIKNPIAIQVYPTGTIPKHPYKVIAKESVSKYNFSGIKRQEATIRDALRNLAASVGGDAIINVTRHDTHVTGTVVMYDDKRIG